MKKLVFVVAMAMFQVSFAGTGSGKVTIEHIGNWNSKDLLFFHTKNQDNKPTCAANAERWVVDLTTDLGKQQYSLILAAAMANKEIRVSGLGHCDLYSNTETAVWVGLPLFN